MSESDRFLHDNMALAPSGRLFLQHDITQTRERFGHQGVAADLRKRRKVGWRLNHKAEATDFQELLATWILPKPSGAQHNFFVVGSSPLNVLKPVSIPDSTKSRLLPLTMQERLSTLGDDVADIVRILNAGNYIGVIDRFQSLTYSMRNLILSGGLSDETSETLDILLGSLETIAHEMYECVRTGNIVDLQKDEVIVFLKGLDKAFHSYARLD
jgi:hypothetical protein